MAASAIGIDLGTTSACVAHLSEGNIAFLCPVPEGIPSVLALDESGKLLVGEAAKKRLREAPEAGLSGTKRLIGRSSNTVVDQVRQLFTYELEDGEDDSLLLRIQEEVMTLEQVTAAILGEVKRMAEAELETSVHQAVITVPAYFNDRQREAVVSAARVAGLEVLSLLNEPTAAALAYGHGKGLNERVAVFDLGGGTLDIAVIDIADNVFEVVAAGGDTFLGGVDFDEAIAQWALAAFLEKHPVEGLGPFALPRIRSIAEEAKIALSDKSIVPLFVPVLAGDSEEGLDLNEDISRDQLEALTKSLLDQSVSRLRKVLEHAGDRPISKLLIIGGQSQMPSLKAAVLESVGLDMEPHADPRTSVASGAAIFASSLAGTADLALTERLNLSISIGLPDGSPHRIFEAGETLPAQCSRQFTTHQDQQSAILLELFQGNGSTTDRCERLGSLCFGGLRSAPAGDVQLSVRFRLNEEGRLDIRAIDPSTGETVEAHLHTAPVPSDPVPVEEAPESPPPFRMPLPGLRDLQSTLAEESDEETEEEAVDEVLAEEDEVDLEEIDLSLSLEELPSEEPAVVEPEFQFPEGSTNHQVRLGDNSPYPIHLSIRDWVRDFFGGLFGR